MGYDPEAIETRWQKHWKEHDTFAVHVDPEKPKFYVLDMFPYPSGDGLHVGHVEGYTATDIIARYKRMRGFNVLHPMGWDAFGLPAERHAMKHGKHPAEVIQQTSAKFRSQLQRLGFSYDWGREINTTDPGYFKWTQWIFLQMFGSYYDRELGRARPIAELPIPRDIEAQGSKAVDAYRDARRLAYLVEAPVNWCPALKIVLANEEVAENVEAGYEVVRRPMKQWMLRITEYAERLLADLEGLDWPPHVLEIQRNWVGRSEGAEIEFGIQGHDETLRVFTTRPDTLYGATYMVLAPEHPLVQHITTAAQREQVTAYVHRTERRTERDRLTESIEGKKTGVDTGAKAIHPLTGAEIPIWIADYVLMGYGTGAIMAVPAHDERDHAFARAMGLPIVQVVAPLDGAKVDVQEQAWVGEGTAVASPVIDGLPTAQAKQTITAHLQAQGKGVGKVTYKLRDWLFSRQRYWGEPFPLVHRPDGSVRAVDESELPVLLPSMPDYNPSDEGEPPLARATQWRELPDGSLREVNTMPQWAGSCWYYLRFADPTNTELPWAKEAERYWLPVDLYVGGIEHAATHLLYSRFWQKVLFDLGWVHTKEPFERLVNQGMILGATFRPVDGRRTAEGHKIVLLPAEVDTVEHPDGRVEYFAKGERYPVEVQWDKMSKSRGNVVNPEEVIAQYGADAMRMYEMFMGPLEQSAPWQTSGIAGIHRFLSRVHRLVFDDERGTVRELVDGEGTPRQRKLLHRTIEEVTERMERLAFNTAIASLMVFVRDIGVDPLARDAVEQFCLLLAPFAPHLAEEIWLALGHPRSLAYEPWPAADPALLVEDTFTLVVQVNGKKRAEIEAPKSASKDELEQLARAALADRLGHDHAQGLGGSPRRTIVVPGRLVNFVI
jgi:leucyl-tRNA synthetase